ncbi:4-hydroxyphenylacetate 3-hydroxylase family protein [Pseudomonas sp. R5(2019)]|uniref:4-hydroxyphenylacetate 3-hydroxylase family protein n=1 Tax=Pseudomonas sp. R5(2019) TaxID=2697566 RepID=UPI001411F74B|nr:4-hydroxyphenylacetate 3-hydroxylase N-terminal domain-containing protein [Pseudomonas sp. R5(2019)]NBA96039.1 4-hydroxyphenylacetate 3-hydroxylase [Pseudomonas sp. R5(2019)]
MTARTGAELLKGMKCEREVWMGDQRVEDVTEHPQLSATAHVLADIYDLQHEAAEDCLTVDPETGEMINITHVIPRSKEDLQNRHRCIQRVAEKTVGVLGRTPCYKNVTVAGFAGDYVEWAKNGNEAGAERLVEYQKHLRRNDLLLTHALLNATADKSQHPNSGDNAQVCLQKVEDTEQGILVRGARVLATLAPFADELLVYSPTPVSEDGQRFALSFAIPINTPGLKFFCRDSYTTANNIFDQPFSARFDEQDAFVVFDNVEVPRERIFIDGNVSVHNQVTRRTWAANVFQQTFIRAQTKLEFAWGIATAMAEAVGDSSPRTAQLLGEIWSYASLTRAALVAAEEQAMDYGNGLVLPNRELLQPLQAMMPIWMPRVSEIIRQVGSHHLLTTPTLSMLENSELRPVLNKYLRGAGDVDVELRTRLCRLAWDFAGSALASRGDLYERFYLGSSPRAFEVSQRVANKERARALVARFLSEPVPRKPGLL